MVVIIVAVIVVAIVVVVIFMNKEKTYVKEIGVVAVFLVSIKSLGF